MEINERVFKALGYAGLTPFVAATLMAWMGWQAADITAEFIFISYSAIILSFVAGTLWGRALALYSGHVIARLLVLSNVYSLLAWAALLMTLPLFALIALSLGFISVFRVERKCLELPLNDNYSNMRYQLTAIAVGLHLLMILHLVFGGQ